MCTILHQIIRKLYGRRSRKFRRKEKGSSLVIIIIVVLFVLLLTIMGFITYLLTSTSSNEGAVTEAPKGEPNPPQNLSRPTQRGSDYANMGPMYPLELHL